MLCYGSINYLKGVLYIEDYSNKKRVSVIHLEMVREGSLLYNSDNTEKTITDAKGAAKFAASLFTSCDREKFYVVCMDAKLEPITIELAFMGGLSQCNVCIPEVFKSAILSNAHSIMCFHNHPSGDVKPSKEDRKVTQRIKEAGELLGIKLMDHIIIGDNGDYYSFRENEYEV